MSYLKFGPHAAGVGGNYDGFGEYIAGCNAARVPCIVQAVDNSGPAEAVQVLGRDYDVIVFRMTSREGVNLDNSFRDIEPIAFARQRMADIARYWPPDLDRAKVWTVPINEPSKEASDIGWLAAFTLECARISVLNGWRHLAVFSWLDGSKTQDQQLRRLGDGTIALVKGGDYERWRFANSEMQRAEDTSMGGGLAYTQNWARWLPQVVTIGATYTNTPRIVVKRRADCVTTADSITTDYLTIAALHKLWHSPYDLDFTNVLEIHWRKTQGGTIQEKYFIAPGLAYVAWGAGEIEAAVSELPLGRPSLPWSSWGCG
jgi:hypothetical protein